MMRKFLRRRIVLLQDVLMRREFLILSLGLLCGFETFGQHYVYTSNTGSNASLIIPLQSQPMVGTVALQYGDEIAAYSNTGLCVGSVVWNKASTVLVVWGDNQFTPQLDGLRSGDSICLRVWKKLEQKEHPVCHAVYALGNGRYYTDAILQASSLTWDDVTGVLQTPAQLPANFTLEEPYPNPCNPAFNLTVLSDRDNTIAIALYSSTGSVILSEKSIAINKGRSTITFEAKMLPSGMYFVAVRNSSGSFYKKVMVVK